MAILNSTNVYGDLNISAGKIIQSGKSVDSMYAVKMVVSGNTIQLINADGTVISSSKMGK